MEAVFTAASVSELAPKATLLSFVALAALPNANAAVPLATVLLPNALPDAPPALALLPTATDV